MSRDPELRLRAVRTFSQWLLPDYRLTRPHIDWWENEEFNWYQKKFHQRKRFNTHRRWSLHQLLRLTENVEGDTAECGVFKGSSSWLICRSNKENGYFDRMHHCFDSFEGLSTPTDEDGTHWTPGVLSATEDIAKRNLSEFSDIVFYKGWIPDRFEDCDANRFSFVHVDVDLYEPTKDSIEYFYGLISPGGVLLCDDYGFTTCPGATKAVDEFLADKSEKMIALDCGGGFFVKGSTTSEESMMRSRGPRRQE